MNMIIKNAAGNKKMLMRQLMAALFGLMVCAQVIAADRLSLEQLDSIVLPGDEVELRFGFDGDAPAPIAYQIEKPARIVFDLPNTASALPGKYQSLGNGNARSVTVVDTRERTRVIVNLNELAGYKTRVEGNQLYVNIGKSIASKTTAGTDPVRRVAVSTTSAAKTVQGVDFRRGEQGDGQVLIDLSDGSIPVDVRQQGNKILVKFADAKVPENLRRRLDVTDFATPVKSIDTYNENGNGLMVIQPQGDFEYLAYQADNKFTVSVKPVNKDDKRKRQDFAYGGEKLSLNFQDIEVRSVLQLIADFTSLNLVASDSVNGKITLRLQNVPWDQALDLILKTKGLDKRTIGNVMLVAPADEIAQRERLEMESNSQTEKLAQLRSEFIQVNYAKAADVLALISGANKLLSDRGKASVDSRTNTLIVMDTAKRIEDIRDIVTRLDVPVRQVLIEARVVLATTGYSKDLGVKWGVTRDHQPFSDRRVMMGGTRKTIAELWEGRDCTSTPCKLDYTITQPDDLVVDLGVEKTGASSFAIGFQGGSNLLLDLELSAMQSDGNAEIVATPKVLTADKQKARIAAGQQIPYQQATSSGATAIAFQNAELSLDVTPSITPDGRISMALKVNNDSPGDIQANGSRAINTNQVETNVLVDDGQTVVLGGIFQTNTSKQVVKTPFLGDIPIIGRLFRRDSVSNNKQELLIFITPRLVTDTVASK